MKLKYNIIVLLLLACLTSSFGQDCYKVEVDHVGAGAFYHDLLEVVSCELKDSITKNTTDDFEVLAYNLYPVLGAVDNEFGIEGTLTKVEEDLATKSNYLAIIKKINFEHDQYSTTPSHNVEYVLKLDLPDNENNQLSDLDKGALMETLHNKAAEEIARTGNTVATEALIMQKLAKSLDGLTTEENLSIMGYTFIPSESSDQVSSKTLGTPVGNQFATIELKEAGGGLKDISEYLNLSGEDAMLKFKMKNQDWDFSLELENGSNLITSNNQTLDQAFVEAEKLVDDQVNIHVHHDEDSQGLYFKFGFTENTAILFLDLITAEVLGNAGYSLYEPGGFAVKGDNENSDSRSTVDDWNYAKRFMADPKFDLLFPEGTKYGGGIACGLVDGLLTSIELIWDLAKGISEAGSGFLSSAFSYFKEVYQEGCKNGILAAGSKLSKDTIAAGTKFYENVKSAVTFIRGALYNLTYDQIKSFMKTMYESVKEWFGTLLSLTKEGGYQVGKIAFDVILTFFTGGAAAGAKAAKYLDKIMKLLKKWDLDNIAHNIAGMLRAAEDLGTQAQKIFKCKILGKGCFIKDTPVLMAGNANRYSLRNSTKAMAVAAAMPIVAVPIQEVQLLDYAVAHETVNSSYGLTASTDEDIYPGLMDEDPYTSDQQRERDEYEINETDWNEVVFEEVNGFSTAKLALHNDWIKDKGYQVDATVNLDLPEMGISGLFEITSIKHIIPQKKPVDDDDSDDYDYKPVTGLFTHVSNDVLNISFDNGESLGVTYGHPIYSVTAGDWRLAGALVTGERVLTKSGEATVTKSLKKKGVETVYNLEIKDWHNFLVGKNGTLVHNLCYDLVKKRFAIYAKNGKKIRGYHPSPGTKRKLSKKAKTEESKYQARADKDGKTIRRDNDGNMVICYDDFGFPDFNDFVPKFMGKDGNLFDGNIDIGSMSNLLDHNKSDFERAFEVLKEMLPADSPLQALSKVSHVPFDIDGVRYTFHHHQDCKTMQIVPSAINASSLGGAPHIGGASLSRNLEQKDLNLFKENLSPEQIKNKHLKGCE